MIHKKGEKKAKEKTSTNKQNYFSFQALVSVLLLRYFFTSQLREFYLFSFVCEHPQKVLRVFIFPRTVLRFLSRVCLSGSIPFSL